MSRTSRNFHTPSPYPSPPRLRSVQAGGRGDKIEQLSRIALWVVIAVCCGLPLTWLIVQIASHPAALIELRQDSFRLHLLGRTLLYNGCSAIIATLIAMPAAIVLGRGRGMFALAMWLVLPISLLMPSIAFAYGWKQFFRLLGRDFDPAGPQDVMRCIWTLATWLWPLPAGLVGLALRRIDTQVQEQATIDGALWRMTLRQLLGPILAGLCLVMVLATQEFAVYEPTGISVVATETRMVFETGAFSSTLNPITQQMGFGSGALSPDQPHRAAAAAITDLPLLIVIALLVYIARWQGKRLGGIDNIDVGDWPRRLDAPRWCIAISWMLIGVTLLTPMVSMYLSLARPFHLSAIYNEFAPQIDGSITIALVAGIVALLLSFLSAIATASGAAWLGALTFLIGGPLLAIGMIRIYNQPALTWIYNGLPIIVMAYVARFGWIALLAGGATWGLPWRQVRELAATDGASPIRTAGSVIWPIAWPILGAGGVLVMILSLTEVPATVLISPQNPQPLIPMMMTWVHMQRYDSMIEASLLLCAAVSILGICATMLVMFARRQLPMTKHQ